MDCWVLGGGLRHDQLVHLHVFYLQLVLPRDEHEIAVRARSLVCQRHRGGQFQSVTRLFRLTMCTK